MLQECLVVLARRALCEELGVGAPLEHRWDERPKERCRPLAVFAREVGPPQPAVANLVASELAKDLA